MRIVKKVKKQKDTATISFRVDLPLKKEWDKFCKENNVSKKDTITQILREVMDNDKSK